MNEKATSLGTTRICENLLLLWSFVAVVPVCLCVCVCVHAGRLSVNTQNPTMDPSKRRLSIVLYRNLLRCCQEVDPRVVLTPYLDGSDLTTNDGNLDLVSNSNDLRSLVRNEFRFASADPATQEDVSDRVSKGLRAMKRLNEIIADLKEKERLGVLEFFNNEQDESEDDCVGDEDTDLVLGDRTNDSSTKEQEQATEKTDLMVEWLPALHSMSATETMTEEDSKVYPMFPLGGPLYDPMDPLLPLFSAMSDVAVPGNEMPLKIFEPRYRQLYDDLLRKPVGDRHFVVPYCHPTDPRRYARYGALWEVVSVQEVADETNGIYQYVADHVVTKTVRLERIINPLVMVTQETYVEVAGTVLDDEDEVGAGSYPSDKHNDDNDVTTNRFGALYEELNQWDDVPSIPFETRMISALETKGLWGAVAQWTQYLQQMLLSKQLAVAARIKIHKAETTEEIIQIQGPHRGRLISLLTDLSTLMPCLLQAKTETERCSILVDCIKRERSWLVGEGYRENGVPNTSTGGIDEEGDVRDE